MTPDAKPVERICIVVAVLVAQSLLVAGCNHDRAASESGNYFMEAQKAIRDGDTERAIELLTKSIESAPSTWAHFQRGTEAARIGNDDLAREDIQAIEAVEPEHNDLPWLRGELEKPVADRFQGRNAQPPSQGK